MFEYLMDVLEYTQLDINRQLRTISWYEELIISENNARHLKYWGDCVRQAYRKLDIALTIKEKILIEMELYKRA